LDKKLKLLDMIDLIKYTDENKKFSKELLEHSFPEDERPDFDVLISRNNPEYNFFIITENSENRGIIGYWEFDNFIHIEHFAIDVKMRNSGLGGRFLNDFFAKTSKLITLEVEVPDNEMSQRRIKFYERYGLHLNEYYYMQPSYKTKEFVMQQYIMSNKKLTAEEFEKLKIMIYKNIYLI
jgi:ribosomal protein S18 acetylase RimI-like enzyme